MKKTKEKKSSGWLHLDPRSMLREKKFRMAALGSKK